MLHTTFARAKKARACIASYEKFAAFKGGVKKWGENTPIPLSEVLEICGLDDALWCLRIIIEPTNREIRLFACDCAERGLSLFENQYPKDNRPRQAIEMARRFAKGETTQAELYAAGDAAWDAARDAAWDAEREWQKQHFIELLNSFQEETK